MMRLSIIISYLWTSFLNIVPTFLFITLITMIVLYILGCHQRRRKEIDDFIKKNNAINDKDTNRVLETIKKYQELKDELDITIKSVNGIVEKFKPEISYVLSSADDAYFRFLYEYSRVSVIRVDRYGNISNYNDSFKTVFTSLISKFSIPIDDIIKTVIINKLFEAFGFNDHKLEDVKTASPIRTIKFGDIDEIIRVSVIFEYDDIGNITYFNFFAVNLGTLDNIIKDIIHIDLKLSRNIAKNQELVNTIKQEHISKMFDDARLKGIMLATPSNNYIDEGVKLC